MKSKLEVVVGAQYGSEAKGHVVQRLTERAQDQSSSVEIVRVAGPNAGHTGYDALGRPWAFRQVPVAAVTKEPASLGIAAGSEIDLPVLLDEIDRATDAGLLANKFLWVSGEATMITDEHKETEAGLVGRIGSTGKGIGAARAQRIYRVPGMRLIDNPEATEALAERGVGIAGHDYRPNGDHVIIEGTQGYGLGLHAGYYPQCTSSDCRAQDFIAMAGVAPWQFRTTEVWAVARMYPIRVAGNSGPLRNETTWKDLGLPEERTTVTKKVRRVGMPDWDLVRGAVNANGGSPTVRLAVTMVDQMFTGMRDRQFWQDEDLPAKYVNQVWQYMREVERVSQAHIGLMTTGPNTASFR